ncbi:MAG: DUF4058 family protein [bacterium]|nr:DUF4058 family protein [bacterium]
MMAGKNPYPGVNAHLNSYLQPSGWATFHTPFLGALSAIIDNYLPDGYYAAAENSLQITHRDPEYEFAPLNKERTISDVLISRIGDTGRRLPQSQYGDVVAPNITMPLELMIFPDELVMAIVVYSLINKTFPGEPIVRLELLSPGNKQPSQYFLEYLKKRKDSILSGLRLVEIDLIHQRKPILPHIPNYTNHEADSTPYYVIVTDPHARDELGQVELYQIGLLDPLPKFYVPLEGDDKFILDLAQVYQQVYDNSRLFQQLGNPASELKNPSAYSADDQQRITEWINNLKQIE